MSCKRSRRSGRLPGRSPPMAAVTWTAPRTAPPLCPGTWRLTRHTCSTTRSRWCRWVIIPLSNVSQSGSHLCYRISYHGHLCLLTSCLIQLYLIQSVYFSHSAFVLHTTLLYNCRFQVLSRVSVAAVHFTRLTHSCPSNNTSLTCLSNLLHSLPCQYFLFWLISASAIPVPFLHLYGMVNLNLNGHAESHRLKVHLSFMHRFGITHTHTIATPKYKQYSSCYSIISMVMV